MPHEHLPHDQELLKGITLFINQDTGAFGPIKETPIEFQFVPKILSDSRKGSWKEKEVIGEEPISPLAFAGPRIMSMKWTYIVEEIGAPLVRRPSGTGVGEGPHPSAFGIWNIARIRRNINVLRGYFLTAKGGGTGSHKGLVCKLTWPLVGGINMWTCRITSVDVKHSENMVGNRDIMYAVKSDITIDLRTWTKGNPDAAAIEVVQNVDGMNPMPSFGDYWY